MRTGIKIGLLGLLIGLFCWTRATADMSTPFVEGPSNKVGAISEAYGYVLTDGSDDGPAFAVLVMSDEEQNIRISASAEKGVVPPALIGRWAIIKAQVVKATTSTKYGSSQGVQLKILSVRSGRKPEAAGPTTAPSGK